MEYVESDLVRIAKRENNTKRGYLVVNPLQGKHISVKPSKALELFSALAKTFVNQYKNEHLLLVGFAETATAIGAQAAIAVGAKYIQTTREIVADADYLFFSEEHSHATEQKLVKNDIDSMIGEIDRIIFVEDEVTTGNTILNIISILEKLYSGKLCFSVASLLNGMSEENLKRFADKNISLHYLAKTDHSKYEDRADDFIGDGNYYECMENDCGSITLLNIQGKMDARRLVNALHYEAACNKLWESVLENIGGISGNKILVVGTEEFMYPALFVGKKLEEYGNDVWCHSTTRSPIAVSMEKEYPLHNRYELRSLYDKERKTFLYDIGKYDKVFIVTDAADNDEGGMRTLINALKVQNNNITLVRWI